MYKRKSCGCVVQGGSMLQPSQDLEAYRLHFNSIAKSKDLLAHRSKVHCVSWSLDGNKLASGSSDNSIRIWSMDEIASVFQSSTKSSTTSFSVELIGHERVVNQVSWCPFDANILASCSNDKTVRIWNMSTNNSSTSQLKDSDKDKDSKSSNNRNTYNISTISTNSENLNLNWHPFERILIVGTKDDQVLLFQFNETFSDSKLIQSLKFNSEVNEISFSSDGEDLLVTLGTGHVEIFRLNKSSSAFEKYRTLYGHTADCYCVRFSGNLMVIGGADAQVTLWDKSQDYTCFKVLNRMEWPIRTLSFSYDSEFIAIGSEDSFIAVEHVKSGSLITKVSTSGKGGVRAGIPINSVSWHPNKYILAYAGDEIDDRTGKSTGAIKLFGLC